MPEVVTPSPIQRLHPTARIVLLLLAFGWMLLFTHPLPALLPFVVAFTGMLLARGLPQLRRLLPLVLTLACMTVLMWAVLAPGKTALMQFIGITITSEGLAYAVTMALRITGMVIAGIAFTAATSVEELRLGLCHLGIPYPLAFATGLAFRLVPVFSAMLQTTIQAQQIRGHILNDGNLLQRLRKYAPLIIPVIVLSLRNTDQLAVALASRGYGRPGTRTSILNHTWRWPDTLTLVTAVLVIALTYVMQH